MNKTWLNSLFLCGLVMAMTCGPVESQVGESMLTGEFRDPSGPVIAKAKVTATAVETKQTQTAITTAAGVYSIPNLNLGAYPVIFIADGFKQLVREGLRVATT